MLNSLTPTVICSFSPITPPLPASLCCPVLLRKHSTHTHSNATQSSLCSSHLVSAGASSASPQHTSPCNTSSLPPHTPLTQTPDTQTTNTQISHSNRSPSPLSLLKPYSDVISDVLQRARLLGVCRFACNGVSPNDWPLIAALSSANANTDIFGGGERTYGRYHAMVVDRARGRDGAEGEEGREEDVVGGVEVIANFGVHPW
eukprot:GHVQ01011221.1.p1 GENE.GHVQ01011221.1~~GHVQ01011221.1.p1  ORF type:complete len:202 (+),score=44.14 GHVQ01011221.1:3-608(+)